MPGSERDLTVAVTGPTGTFGFGLVPLLQADERVARVVGIARRPFDPAVYGWTKLDYRRGDVRDQQALQDAFAGADVVVHLAFLITGAASRQVIRAINVGGTLNAFRAAAAAGARRFVFASSVAAYGFHPDNPVGMTEEWPVRPAARLFYAQEKAELERLLLAEAAQFPGLAVYLLRPSIVLGPHTMGGKALLPGPLGRLVGRVPCCGASSPAGRLAPTTSRPTGSSPPPTLPVNSACLRCLSPLALPRSWRGPSPPCPSCHRLPGGWRRPAIRRSWTRPGRRRSWGGPLASARWRHCVTPCGREV